MFNISDIWFSCKFALRVIFHKLFLISVLFLISFSNAIYSQSEYVKFINLTSKNALKKAKNDGKIVYIDCYTSWCGPCKWMDKNIFSNDSVANFYNSNFICLKIDMEKGEGFEFASKYKINTYPTSLYLSANGEMVFRTCGAKNSTTFIKDGQNALNPDTQLSNYSIKFKQRKLDPKSAYLYFELLEGACLAPDSLIKEYLLTQPNSSLIFSYNWKIIYKWAKYSYPSFRYLESNIESFSKAHGKDSVEYKINEIYRVMLQQAYLNKNRVYFEFLEKKLKKLKTRDAEKIVLETQQLFTKIPNSDVVNAIEIKDSIVGPINVGKGYGNFMEHKNGFISESNSIWFKLNIQIDTILTFDLFPLDSLNDYDFVIYKCTSTNFINDVKTNKVKPIRTCFSYCTSKSGVTGLSNYTDTTYIDLGPGPAYVSGIPVKKGEIYYILVNYGDIYVNRNLLPYGFIIYFYNYWPKRKSIPLCNVFFESNSANLSSASYKELDELVRRLQNNELKIEVQGHSDETGSEAGNLVLSENRAKSIVEYLKSKGISSGRLFYKGFGSRNPVATNNTIDGRKKNRRVEYTIIFQ